MNLSLIDSEKDGVFASKIYIFIMAAYLRYDFQPSGALYLFIPHTHYPNSV